MALEVMIDILLENDIGARVLSVVAAVQTFKLPSFGICVCQAFAAVVVVVAALVLLLCAAYLVYFVAHFVSYFVYVVVAMIRAVLWRLARALIPAWCRRSFSRAVAGIVADVAFFRAELRTQLKHPVQLYMFWVFVTACAVFDGFLLVDILLDRAGHSNMVFPPMLNMVSAAFTYSHAFPTAAVAAAAAAAKAARRVAEEAATIESEE